MQYAQDRLDRLKKLSDHAWYKKVLVRLSEAEFDQVVEIIEDHGDEDKDRFTHTINRLWLDGPKPKHFGQMLDVLMAIR